MKNITSVDNKIVLKAASLKEKKYREKFSLYLIEGKRAVFDALNQGVDVDCVFIRDDDTDAISAIKGEIPIYCVNDRIMNKICGTVNPQSIAAVLKIKTYELSKPNSNIVILDGISDPGNLGTIIRTAAACGLKEIFLCSCTDPYNPKCVRASMGGINFVKLFQESASNIIKYVKMLNYKIVCADMGGTNFFNCEIRKNNIALVIGNEARGVSETFFSESDLSVSIPMENIESLNAAVSASILMYFFKYCSNKE